MRTKAEIREELKRVESIPDNPVKSGIVTALAWVLEGEPMAIEAKSEMETKIEQEFYALESSCAAWPVYLQTHKELASRLAKRMVLIEREACAKIALSESLRLGYDCHPNDLARCIGEAIRSRK